jgi:hypothetical protein
MEKKMPRPYNKQGLLTAAQDEHQALEQLIEPLTVEQMDELGVLGEWAVKDVLAHLIEWEQMVLGWYAAGLRGETPHLPAPGFNWGQLPALNQQIYEKHHNRTVEDILSQFRASYRQVIELVQGLSEDELFTTGRYAWAGKNALAAYLTSCTSSHYRWARTEMRKGLKAKQKKG